MKVTWEVDDGYAGGSRPQHTEIPECDIEDCEDIDEAIQMVKDMIQEEYDQNINWYLNNHDKVKKKLQEILDNRKEEE